MLAILKSFAPKARDGRRHLLLVGFPIPAHIGEDSHEMTLIYETQTEDGLFNGLRLIEKQYEYREN